MIFSKNFKLFRRMISALVVCVALAGCASVDITKTTSSYYDPTNPNNIEILKTPPSRAYEELGTLTVTGFQSDETAKMYNAMRAKASELGANAVIITSEGLNPSAIGYMRWASAVAVRYKGASK